MTGVDMSAPHLKLCSAVSIAHGGPAARLLGVSSLNSGRACTARFFYRHQVSAGLRQILRDFAKPRDQPRHLLAQPVKAGAAVKIPLVHVDRPVDLDLQRVAAMARTAVMAGGKAAG